MGDWDYSIVWQEAMNQMKAEVSEQEFAMWFNFEYKASTEKEIIVSVPSTFYRDQVRERYQYKIENKLRELIGQNLSLQMTVQERASIVAAEAPKSIEKPATSGTASSSPSSIATPSPARKIKPPNPQLPENQTFENYIIGDNNRYASNAALAISKNPGKAYNPFLIYGGVGLGKTHLMRAIGHRIYETTDLKIIFITAEDFTNEFIQSLEHNKTTAFKNKYRYADVLLIDDIHFLENKSGTQEELFYTFNALYDANKQMVFTCDRPASELKNLSDRLRSRFERGLNVDLQPPDYEMRVAILRKKSEARGVEIPDDVIELLSRNVTTHVRDLEAALTKLFGYVELVGKKLTVDIAQQLLKDTFASYKQPNISIEVIQRVVADEYSLSYNDLKGKKRTKNIAFPRQLAMYVARKMTEYSTTEVGMEFGGRDHTTVMHACQKIEELCLSDPQLDSRIKNIIKSIKQYSAKG